MTQLFICHNRPLTLMMNESVL